MKERARRLILFIIYSKIAFSTCHITFTCPHKSPLIFQSTPCETWSPSFKECGYDYFRPGAGKL